MIEDSQTQQLLEGELLENVSDFSRLWEMGHVYKSFGA